LARRTINALELWNHPELATAGWFRWPTAKPVEANETAVQSRAIDAFVRNLSVTPIRNSRLVDVKFRSASPALAATVANTLARTYAEQHLEYKFLASKEASDWLGERLAEQRTQVEAAEARLQQYRERNDVISLEDRENIVVQKLADLNGAVTKAKTERIQKEALYEQLRVIRGNDLAALDTFPAILSNAFIQQLKVQLADLQRQQVQLAERLGELHPDMIKVRSAIRSAETRLQGEVAKVVEGVRNEYLAALSQERSLAATLDAQKGDALAQNRKGIEYGVLQREAESHRQIYETLLQRAKETGVSTELRTSNVRIVDPAETPRAPARPRQGFNLILGLLGGSLFGLGLAFFFEYLDDRVKSPEDIRTHLKLPTLGMLPALSKQLTNGEYPLVSNGAPSSFVEAVRSVRTNVLFASPEEKVRSILVTSPAPNEGKTLVASNLAISLAQAGQRVLLIDADMRKPALHQVFLLCQEPGLSNLIVGRAKASESIQKSTVRGLWVMTAGRTPPNPAELLGSQRLRVFLKSLRNHFDWVVIDSPPVMAVTDAAVLAHGATGVVFVVGAETTSRRMAAAALEQLGNAHAQVIGGILNRVTVDKHPYYYAAYYRREYAAYYAEAQKQ
ncbi:MAG TPA: polysaccharide biosynthesis tyrosine autokinase, partial [Vicinamibacterales bacterium]